MSVELTALTRFEFDEFRRLQIRQRWDWPAVLSTNWHGEIWPFITYGRTQGQHREEVRGLSDIIDQIADEYRAIRAMGGRFFINDRGAFYKDEAAQIIPFVSFRFVVG